MVYCIENHFYTVDDDWLYTLPSRGKERVLRRPGSGMAMYIILMKNNEIYRFNSVYFMRGLCALSWSGSLRFLAPTG
ncbi:protein of unknown function [Serratia sp. Tan611]|nr:protein of unknown function [Serratia sp. Tan611]